MKTLRQFIEEAKQFQVEEVIDLEDIEDEELDEEVEQIQEAADVELKPHPNGTHYVVHKIHPKSGIESDQLKVGEKISDTHVDDLHDMGYNVKIHKSMKEGVEVIDEASEMEAAAARLKKMKRGSDVSFTHATSGEKVTGKFQGVKRMSGRPYAHVETSKGAFHVPVHQID